MTDQEKYQAVINNDANYDGVFFYAVKSTGIFCRPSCKSKIPNAENLLYFDTAEEAIAAGFRPCKRCRSDLLAYEPMKEIAAQMKDMIDAMFRESSEMNTKLRKVGLSQSRMVDVFKETYGVTPKGYADSLRLQEAEKLLKETADEVIDIALSVGFGSLSAFCRFFKGQKGVSPSVYRKQNRTNK